MPIWDDERDRLTAFDVAYRPKVGDVDVLQVLDDAIVAGTVLTVAAKRSAIDVAKAVESVKAQVVIVVDDQHAIAGYLFPEWVTQQVAKNIGWSGGSLTETVVTPASDRNF